MFCGKYCPMSLQENLAREFRVPVLQRYDKYLGIPSDWGRSKQEMFSWISARVTAKLEGWKERLLSKGGKEILLKLVVQAIPQYAMSVFKRPQFICKGLEQRISSFWWKNDISRRGVHWQKWDALKISKHSGGLGFRDLMAFNKALLGKQAWRLLHSPLSLWSQIFKGLYFPNQAFLHAENGCRPS